MKYSFEIIARGRGLFAPRGQCSLFCKVDCSPAELNFLHDNRLLDTVIYEINGRQRAGKKLLNGVIKVATASPDPRKRQKQNEKLSEVSPTPVTLRQLISGIVLKVTEFETVEAEQVMEARLLELSDTMSVALGKRVRGGRTGGF